MKTNQGFIGRIILLIVAIIALKCFLNFDIIEYLKSQEFRNLVQPVLDFLLQAYQRLDIIVRNIVGK